MSGSTSVSRGGGHSGSQSGPTGGPNTRSTSGSRGGLVTGSSRCARSARGSATCCGSGVRPARCSARAATGASATTGSGGSQVTPVVRVGPARPDAADVPVVGAFYDAALVGHVRVGGEESGGAGGRRLVVGRVPRRERPTVLGGPGVSRAGPAVAAFDAFAGGPAVLVDVLGVRGGDAAQASGKTVVVPHDARRATVAVDRLGVFEAGPDHGAGAVTAPVDADGLVGPEHAVGHTASTGHAGDVGGALEMEAAGFGHDRSPCLPGCSATTVLVMVRQTVR